MHADTILRLPYRLMNTLETLGDETLHRRAPWGFWLRRRTQFVLDLSTLCLAFALAYLLRFDFAIPEQAATNLLTQLPLVVLLQFTTLVLLRAYSFVWRYVGMPEIRTFALAAAVSALPLVALRLGLPNAAAAWRVPLSVIVVDTVLGFGGLLALRVARRMLYERYERDTRSRAGLRGRRKPVLLVGAGRAGVLAVREIHGRGDLDLETVGFVDDDPLKQDMVIHGVRVLGTTADIPRLAREHGIDNVLLTIADAPAASIQRIVETCRRERLAVRSVPGLYELLSGRLEVSRFRDVATEDLLGRDPVQLEVGELERFLTGKRVLVTGAGGSIGSELARQIARFRPGRLLLYERAEFALFDADRELRSLWPGLEVAALVGDIRDADRVRQVLAGERPDVIFHAAAHKHVPMMEDNPAEAIKNNVLGTEVLGRLAGEAGVEAFILISTDKAVRPTSVMGASKRLAELVVQKLDTEFPDTRYLAVRFGNVLGSAGSVMRIFQEQITRGGPVTVTHPEMKRYFMTIPEAAQLVIQAGALGRGGEIFVLDMGEPVRILELAEKMIRLSGFTPGEDVEIVFSGTRPGEKLFEELELAGEELDKTRHPKIFVGRFQPYAPERLAGVLERLAQLAIEGKGDAIRAALGELLPEATLEGRGAPDDGGGAPGADERSAIAGANPSAALGR
ncbi:MAG TPA: nucleoside-diphosphate sugar epimerase/dehydratase [Thermoanaerobaculia bacterium]|nr:nucleoside-diphosphate sugar epimerase/dehydratase [Thermoanaerobaculia bacterium]